MDTFIPEFKLGLIASLVIIFISILLVAVLASSEAAILSISKVRVRDLEKQGFKRAKVISELLSDHDKFFATILTTENALIIFASSVSATLIHGKFLDLRTLLSALIITILIVIFGQITPKTFAVRNSEIVALNMAFPIKFLVIVLRIPIRILSACSFFLILLMGKIGISSKEEGQYSATESEIRLMIEEGRLHQDERELLQNVFEFGDTVASEVMIPRTQIKAIPYNYTVKEALLEMVAYGHSKFPVFNDSIDNIVGIVYVKELVNAILENESVETVGVDKYIRPAIFIPENKKITDILKMMQERKIQLFLVADEYGGTEGLVTVEDLLEEIVGEIKETIGGILESNTVETVDESTIVVNGSVYIDDLNEESGLELPEGDYQTIAGFILKQLGKIPKTGEKFKYKNMEIIITEVVGS